MLGFHVFFAGVGVDDTGSRVELAVGARFINAVGRADGAHLGQLVAQQAFNIESHIRGLALGVDLQCFCTLIIDNGKLGRGICVALGSGNAQETKRFVGKVNLVDSCRFRRSKRAQTDCHGDNQQPGKDFSHGDSLLVMI